MRRRVLYLLLLLGFLVPGLVRAAPRDAVRSDPEIAALRSDIQCLNLINGLNLTDEQLRQLLDVARRADAIRQEVRRKAADLDHESKPALEELRALLRDGKEASPELAARVRQVSGGGLQLLAGLRDRLAPVAQEALKILNENQLALLDEYKPCLIPPRGRDTARLGQAPNSRDGLSQMASLVRRMPEPRYRRVRERLANQAIARMERHARGRKVTPEQREQFLKTLDEIRGLTDVQFEAQREELLKRLDVLDVSDEIRKQNELRRVQRAIQFLLHPGLADLIGHRAGQQDKK